MLPELLYSLTEKKLNYCSQKTESFTDRGEQERKCKFPTTNYIAFCRFNIFLSVFFIQCNNGRRKLKGDWEKIAPEPNVQLKLQPRLTPIINGTSSLVQTYMTTRHLVVGDFPSPYEVHLRTSIWPAAVTSPSRYYSLDVVGICAAMLLPI